MYQLKIERENGIIENFNFDSFDERDNFIVKNWNDDDEFLIPCSFGGWIDVRDCY